MADAERVTARQRAILTAIIESYIETGEPVGSGTIARLQHGEGSGFSSATVRNEMAELADEGLLEQPHTSAGRVPTARAFRMYVEQLSGGAHPRIDAARLSARSRSQIDLSLQGVAGTQALLERTSHVLATLSSGVGVAIAVAQRWDGRRGITGKGRGGSGDRPMMLHDMVTRCGRMEQRCHVLNLEKVCT